MHLLTTIVLAPLSMDKIPPRGCGEVPAYHRVRPCTPVSVLWGYPQSQESCFQLQETMCKLLLSWLLPGTLDVALPSFPFSLLLPPLEASCVYVPTDVHSSSSVGRWGDCRVGCTSQGQTAGKWPLVASRTCQSTTVQEFVLLPHANAIWHY